MQDESSERTVVLMVHGGQMSADILKRSIQFFLEKEKRFQDRIFTNTSGRTKAEGKQSLRALMDQGAELSNIKISEDNIADFERVARKYDIDYSLKKDKSQDPPVYLVFFKARDADVMTAAFEEYARNDLKERNDRPRESIRDRLQQKKDIVQKRDRAKSRTKEVKKYKEEVL